MCPRGRYVPAESTKDDARFTLSGGAQLRAHIEAAIDAMKARFGNYVDVERPVVTGFSLGAFEIGELAVSSPERFARVAQLEGGYALWTGARIRTFAQGGGLRVLFGCGSPWCLAPAKDAAARLNKAGLEARVVHANVGHTTDRPLQEAIMAEIAWFLGGDARWSVAGDAGP
jgi:predicted esterase